MDEVHPDQVVNRRKDSERRARLMRILALIEAGELDSENIPKDLLYFDGSKSPRQTYVSPKDRDNYNSGYMEISEMMSSSPNVG